MVDDMQKEVDKKADLVVHEQLVTEVEGLKEKCDENQKDLQAEGTVVRLLIKEKASSSELNELANELRMRAAVDLDKLATQIREKANSADINSRFADILNDVQERAASAEVEASINELRQKVNKVASEVNEKITMVEMAKIVNELKVKADNSELNNLRSDLDDKGRELIEKSQKTEAQLMKHI